MNKRYVGQRSVEGIIKRTRLGVVSEMHERSLPEIPICAGKAISDAVRIGRKKSIGKYQIASQYEPDCDDQEIKDISLPVGRQRVRELREPCRRFRRNDPEAAPYGEGK